MKKTKTTGAKLKPAPLTIELFEAKPNSMFPDWLTALLRFVRFTEAVPCGECGKKKKHHWTLLCQFKAKSMGDLPSFVLQESDKSHAPLTPVCRDHLLSPDWTGTINEKEFSAQ